MAYALYALALLLTVTLALVHSVFILILLTELSLLHCNGCWKTWFRDLSWKVLVYSNAGFKAHPYISVHQETYQNDDKILELALLCNIQHGPLFHQWEKWKLLFLEWNGIHKCQKENSREKELEYSRFFGLLRKAFIFEFNNAMLQYWKPAFYYWFLGVPIDWGQ